MSLPDQSEPVTTSSQLEESPIALYKSAASKPLLEAKSNTRSRRFFGPLIKSYALALRSKIGGSSDMSGDYKAFFTSTSILQRGVPLSMQDSYTNGRIFALSDVMQEEKCPLFSTDGHSFVRYLESYLDHVEDSSRTDEDKVRVAEDKYRAIKREASLHFELAQYKWKDALQQNASLTFDQWMDNYGYDYKDACEERAIAKENLRRAQQSGSYDVLRQKELMNSAVNSQHEVPGSNMPCSMSDVSGATTISSSQDSHAIVYQPLHVLPGFKFTAEEWARKGLKDKEDLAELRIDLLAGFTRTWEELGFSPACVPDKAFKKGGKDLERIRATIKDWKLVLRYTDMQSFDINRGLWNITSFRTILPDLTKTASQDLHQKVFQTSRILLAYNADLVLQLPPELFSRLFPEEVKTPSALVAHNQVNGQLANSRPSTSNLEGLEEELLTELFQTFPFAKIPKEKWDHENELHVRGQLNNLYPAVLGVLARKL